MPLFTNKLKPRATAGPERLHSVKSEDVEAGPFKFDGSRYRDVKKRATTSGPEHIFSSDLLKIAAAKKAAAAAVHLALVRATAALFVPKKKAAKKSAGKRTKK